jgi:phosphatidylglycerophosphate synthase
MLTGKPASTLQRRPLATREKTWAKRLASALASHDVAPNAISVASVAFALVAAVALWLSGSASGFARIWLLLVAAGGIQLRLLCNMLDGMVAVEGAKHTPYGDLYNEIPDRIADVAIFLGAGYGVAQLSFGTVLGWAAALTAVLTAYVRLLGGSLGLTQHFAGPMAKQHRMAVLTAASILSIAEPIWHGRGQVVEVALALIAGGAVVTFVRRIILIGRDIAER